MTQRIVLAAILLLASACGSSSAGGGDGVGGEPDGGIDGGVAWERCYLDEIGPAECATLEMPLDRESTATRTIPFFVRRIPADGVSRGQLWLFQGGPGVNGAQLSVYASTFLLGLGLDIYIPDYRGVGRSESLGCDDADPLSSECLGQVADHYGSTLARFSTTDAVRDIGEAIDRLRGPDEPIFVWGVSYGTYAVNRYLQLFPGQASGAVLDSVCGAAGCELMGVDVDSDRNAHDVADLCAADAFCRGKLGEDPWARVGDVLQRVEAGHCADAVAGVGASIVRPIFTHLMGDFFMPGVAMALIYRLDRCTAADASAVANLIAVFGQLTGGWALQDAVARSDQLYFHVALSEFWDPSFTDAQIAAMERDLVATSRTLEYIADMGRGWPWPRYEVPASQRAWARVTTPVLLLNGTLDAQTRPERMSDAREAFTAPNQHVVLMPYANHGVFATSARSGTDGKQTCGAALTRAFLTDPTKPLDVSCVDAQPPPAFDRAEYQSHWFGTPDLWENGSSARGLRRSVRLDAWTRARLDAVRAAIRDEVARGRDRVRHD